MSAGPTEIGGEEPRHTPAAGKPFAAVRQTARPNRSVGNRSTTDVERIREALGFIPVGGHDERVRIAFALKSELGEDGRDLWDEWRAGRGDDEATAVWRSADPSGGVTAGTLFHEAKANGWRNGDEHSRPTPEELAERQRRAAERAQKEEAEIAQERAETAEKAAAILKAASAALDDHPYLQRKRVRAVETLREIDAAEAARILGYTPRSRGEPLAGRLLVVPVKQGDRISTVELIDGDGRKTALAGRGSKGGGYWATEKLPQGDGAGMTLQIGEGMATALTGKEATGHIGISTLSSSNLLAVADAMRKRYPAATRVLLAELVKATGKPDQHAIDAAKATGARLAVPSFGNDRAPDQTDFNDMAAAHGLEAVRSAIAGATAASSTLPQLAAVRASAGEYAREVRLVRASDVKMQPITWLWDGWLARGKLHVLGGAPGTGKTTIAMGLAATVTTGGRWPDGTCATAGNVLVWSGEDDPADTLIPRLALSGADLSRVHFVAGTREGNEDRSFDPARDMESLRRELAEIGDVVLMVLDPIVTAVAGDSHKNAEVRRGLQPVVDLAASMGCAVVGITHFSKGTHGRDPVERLTGSQAFGALARVVLVAAKHQKEGEDGRTVRLFCRAKSNIGPNDDGFEYDLHQAELATHPGISTSSVLWGEAVEGTARELLATADATGDDGEGGALADAKRFLADLLAHGPVLQTSIRRDADSAGYSQATIRRAKRALGVVAEKSGMRGGWVWRMPDEPKPMPRKESAKMSEGEEEAQHNSLSIFAKSEHLRDASPSTLRRQSPKMLKNDEDAQQNVLTTFAKSEHLQDAGGDVEVEI
jgi:putative DNA primase/helicase